MKTRKLFTENVYLTKSRTVVTDHRVISKKENSSGDTHLLVLDETIFFPTGGGQSCDIGQIMLPPRTGEEPISFDVIDVFEENGTIFHEIKGDKNPIPISAGEEVICQINWQHRFENMQRHCGEHLFSGTVYRLYKGINCGFHMGKDFMTADIMFDENSPYKAFTQEMAKETESLVNSYICQDLPVNTLFYSKKEDALALPLRKELKVENDISVVMIAADNGSMIVDCVACCGTHPSTTGQIGLFKIYKIEKNKGMFRVYFDAGKKALTDYQMRFEIVNALAIKHSTSADLLLDVIDRREKEAEAAKNALILTKKRFLNQLADSINEDISKSFEDLSSNSSEVATIHRSFDFLSADDILNIGKLIIFKPHTLVLISDLQTNTLFLFSDGGKDVNCKELVQKAVAQGAKGGGSASSARIKFADAEAIKKARYR